mgnify:CR=1 FL=1
MGQEQKIGGFTPEKKEEIKPKKLSEALREVQVQYPEIATLPAYKAHEALIKAFSKKATETGTSPALTYDQRALDILLRAHMASRAGNFHDTESTVNIKSDFEKKYGISSEWDGEERAV